MPRLTPLVLLAFAAAVPAESLADTLFDRLDVFELETAADPQISPDGSSVVYVRRAFDIMSDSTVSHLWIVGADGRGHRALLSAAASYASPRWSPDGTRLAYVTDVAEKGPQIHVRWMDTGQTATLSNVRSRPQALAWSPDGTRIAFEMFVKGEAKPLAAPPAVPEGAEWAAPATVIETMPYRADGAGYLDVGHAHLFVLSAEGGTPRQLTRGDYDHRGPLSWAADGSRILFAANRQPDWEHDPIERELWSVDVASGAATRLTDRDGPDHTPRVSPDGSRVAYLGFDDRRLGYHNADVYVLDLESGRTQRLTGGLDRSVDDLQWAGRSDRLYVRYDDRGRTLLATLSLKGDISPLVDDVGGLDLGRPYTSGSFSTARNGAFAYTAGRPDRPADVAAGRAGRPARRLTRLNDDLLGHKTLGELEELSWRSRDGDYAIQGWLVKPPGFDPRRRYPFILEIHGGPFAAYGPQFSAEVRLYAARGYVVLYANPRGSTSYGHAFANEIHHDYPGEDFEDLMAGVDAVLERGFVDPDRLFVTGGSGGGVLTAWTVGMTDRFRAAVVAKPVINWTSFTLTADGTHFFTRYWFADMPWDAPEAYWKRSPLALVGNVATPTAVLTGELDYRTPIAESEQYYQALKLRKVDTALIRIPEASHGIAARPSQLIAKVDNVLAWFERHDTAAAAD